MFAHIDPNLFAYAALFSWPLVALWFYSRFPVGRATIWTILGGFLLLPVALEVKIPMIPAFEKSTIPNIAAAVGCLFFARRKLKIFYGFGITEILLLGLVIGPFVTSVLNTEPVIAAGRILPGVGVYDAGSAVIYQVLYIIPFFLGRQFLRRPEDNLELLRVLVIAGLIYSIPMLFEVRMSPQLHTWVYGYFPTSFLEQFRQGGFRPIVFLGHGLVAAFFAMTTAVAAAALWRLGSRIRRFHPGAVTAYLSVVVVLCKTFSSFVYGGILVPLVRWAKPRTQLRVAVIFAAIAVSYPMLRTLDLIPTTQILSISKSIDSQRAGSLETRFDNEYKLLNKAWRRIWFGWGRYGRNRVFDEETGADESITDGAWIIALGQFGLFGFFSMFGLLAMSVVRAAAAFKYASTQEEGITLAALALIVAINIIDLLPNSTISPWTWLLVGALTGRAEALYATSRQRAPAETRRAAGVRLQKSHGRLT